MHCQPRRVRIVSLRESSYLPAHARVRREPASHRCGGWIIYAIIDSPPAFIFEVLTGALGVADIGQDGRRSRRCHHSERAADMAYRIGDCNGNTYFCLRATFPLFLQYLGVFISIFRFEFCFL